MSQIATMVVSKEDFLEFARKENAPYLTKVALAPDHPYHIKVVEFVNEKAFPVGPYFDKDKFIPITAMARPVDKTLGGFNMVHVCDVQKFIPRFHDPKEESETTVSQLALQSVSDLVVYLQTAVSQKYRIGGYGEAAKLINFAYRPEARDCIIEFAEIHDFKDLWEYYDSGSVESGKYFVKLKSLDNPDAEHIVVKEYTVEEYNQLRGITDATDEYEEDDGD